MAQITLIPSLQSMRLLTNLVSMPALWALVQEHLSAPVFKRELYCSKLNPPCRLLDFGCASGHLGDAFRDLEYYGVDLDPVAIEAAKQRFHDQPTMHFLAADLRERPFPREFFDEILFAGTAHHLDDELLGSVLTELHFCLKCGGTVHLFDPVFQERTRLVSEADVQDRPGETHPYPRANPGHRGAPGIVRVR